MSQISKQIQRETGKPKKKKKESRNQNIRQIQKKTQHNKEKGKSKLHKKDCEVSQNSKQVVVSK